MSEITLPEVVIHEVDPAEHKAVAVMTPGHLISQAIDRDADVEKLAKLMDLQERWDARAARSEYFAALSRFQASVPPIPRGREVKKRDGTLMYRYAPLDDVLRAIKPVLLQCGLSYRWETESADEELRVTCYVTHVSGHTETTSVSIPGIAGHGTNSAQDRGSAISYGKRYSLTNALGLQPEDDDDAGSLAGTGHLEVLYRMVDVLRDPDVLSAVAMVKNGLNDDDDLEKAAEAYAELSKDEVAALWVAPSKGGVWSTKERKRIKEDSEFQSMVQTRRDESDWHNRNH